MSDVSLASLYGASSAYDSSTGIFSCKLAELHAIAVTNNNHILNVSGKLIKIIPDTFNPIDWNTPSEILRLILSAFHSYTIDNPKTESGILSNDRKCSVSVTSMSVATNFEGSTGGIFVVHNGSFSLYNAKNLDFDFDPTID